MLATPDKLSLSWECCNAYIRRKMRAGESTASTPGSWSLDTTESSRTADRSSTSAFWAQKDMYNNYRYTWVVCLPWALRHTNCLNYHAHCGRMQILWLREVTWCFSINSITMAQKPRLRNAEATIMQQRISLKLARIHNSTATQWCSATIKEEQFLSRAFCCFPQWIVPIATLVIGVPWVYESTTFVPEKS